MFGFFENSLIKYWRLEIATLHPDAERYQKSDLCHARKNVEFCGKFLSQAFVEF